MTSGQKLSAAEALDWGLVAQVVERDGLAERTAEVAARYAAMPTRGVGMTKRLFSEAARNRLEEQLELEADLQTAATETNDFREGVAAFLEKRKPEFTGS
jgi:2-(1,2-epoxy-1,2-dihydrophenyl)acetyl-CoA isomerase